VGGILVDRGSAHGVVGDAIAGFAREGKRVLAVAPKGTRKPVARYRSGFIHIARGARVPILLITLDYGARCVRLGPTYTPTDDVEAELARVEAFYANVRGKNPHATPSVLVPPRTKP
jgi:1-acyl-sn-glycerol-3-phosphate acyltransferase